MSGLRSPQAKSCRFATTESSSFRTPNTVCLRVFDFFATSVILPPFLKSEEKITLVAKQKKILKTNGFTGNKNGTLQLSQNDKI